MTREEAEALAKRIRAEGAGYYRVLGLKERFHDGSGDFFVEITPCAAPNTLVVSTHDQWEYLYGIRERWSRSRSNAHTLRSAREEMLP